MARFSIGNAVSLPEAGSADDGVAREYGNKRQEVLANQMGAGYLRDIP